MNCPFCDSPGWMLDSKYPPGKVNLDKPPIYFISCLACGATGPRKHTSYEAGEAWILTHVIKNAPEIVATIPEAN